MPLTAEQHKERLTGIGASDAAAALGLSPWKTPLELYLEKTNAANDGEDEEEKEYLYWGNKLERDIAEGWSERTGIKLRRVNRTLRHSQYPHMLMHLDRQQIGTRIPLECKNVNEYHAAKHFGEEFTDDVPDQYLTQCHHQIIIARDLWGIEKCELAALIGGNRLRRYKFTYDEELAELIIHGEAKFWQHVLNRRPPPPQTINDLTTLYAQDNGQIKDVDAGVLVIWNRYHEIKERADMFAGELNNIKDELRFAIAESAGIKLETIEGGPEAPGIQYAGKTLATWKYQTAKRLDTKRLKAEKPDIYNEYTKESGTRVLRVNKQ